MSHTWFTRFRRLTMAKSTFSIAHKDEDMLALVRATDQKILAVWAIDCAERILPFLEQQFPDDHRPRHAIEVLQRWLQTGVFKMAVIRKASLDAHAAARDVGADTAARSAARAAGQAVATAHVPRHAYGPAVYAQQAIYRATNPAEADAAVAKERDWQFAHLLQLQENTP
jgi:polygalacturonase